MTPFDIQPRTRTIFGPGSLDRLGELAAGLGTRALLVSDPGVVAAGYPNRAIPLLMRAGVEVTLFDGVEENPTTANVAAGVAVAREKEIDLIIGLGGGSSLDCAKGVNFIHTNGGKMEDYWGHDKATQPMLPLIAVPTTAGTGSEAQSYALISNAETHAKMACGDPKAAAAVAILDPELTVTQPPLVTANTGIDAIAHALETWVTKKRNAVSAMRSAEARRLLSDGFPRVLENPKDLDARARMQLGAHFAGAAIEASMLGAAHASANPLTKRFGVVHGSAVGLMLPAIIRYNAAVAGDLYDELGGAETLARMVESFLYKAGIPTRITEHGASAEDITGLAEDASKEWTGQFNPRPVTSEDFAKIYQCVC